jgi:hypothetical protein
VLHDFDVSGFSIAGTLSTDSRRYTFQNELPVIDIGLRLEDVNAMELESEPVATSGDWNARAATLRRHGATDDEIDFLENQRVELNAMTSPQMIEFIESKLTGHGVKKIIPDRSVLEEHARHLLEQRFAEEALEPLLAEVAERAKQAKLPANLAKRVAAELKKNPHLPWDAAVANLVDTD